jgi:ankyrin repeat protein
LAAHNGATPLSRASANGHAAIAQLLLAALAAA